MISSDWMIISSVIFSDNNTSGTNITLGALTTGVLKPIEVLIGSEYFC